MRYVSCLAPVSTHAYLPTWRFGTEHKQAPATDIVNYAFQKGKSEHPLTIRCLFEPNTLLAFRRRCPACSRSTRHHPLPLSPPTLLIFVSAARAESPSPTHAPNGAISAEISREPQSHARPCAMSARRRSLRALGASSSRGDGTSVEASTSTSARAAEDLDTVRGTWIQERQTELDRIFDTHDSMVRVHTFVFMCHSSSYSICLYTTLLCCVDSRSLPPGKVRVYALV